MLHVSRDYIELQVKEMDELNDPSDWATCLSLGSSDHKQM